MIKKETENFGTSRKHVVLDGGVSSDAVIRTCQGNPFNAFRAGKSEGDLQL
jgi:hypothetical protein